MDLVRPRTGELAVDDRLAVVVRVNAGTVRIRFIDGMEPREMSLGNDSVYILSRSQVMPAVTDGSD